MSNKQVIKSNYQDDEESLEDTQIEWSNLIFLPFCNVFRIIVLLSVITKCVLGPIQSVYPVVYCWNVMDGYIPLLCIKYFYWYCCDIIYGIDTFLHIVHRKVTDKAMRREHLPKHAFLLLMDIISLIPFFRLLVTSDCPMVQLWPNILAFTEFLIIYRVVEYFSLVTTHSLTYIITGLTFMMIICLNCVTCFWLLLTRHGFCENCKNNIYDWRIYFAQSLNKTDQGLSTYVFGSSFVYSFFTNDVFHETKPSTMMELMVTTVMVTIGYIVRIFVIEPKLFSEAILKIRRIFAYHRHIKRIVEETRLRNPSRKAFLNVENFYNIMWKKRSGLMSLPKVMTELPRYLRLEIVEDLVWPVFYHSPTLRNTSTSFQTWLCEHIHLDYKLPGERFFSGSYCQTNLYYLKSGIVQIISTDDGVTPVLSVSSGTIFGDISFIVPNNRRKVTVRCLTYCEVFIVSRRNLLLALNKYPEDRINILQSVKERIKHARTLYNCKEEIKGLDRSEDEDLAWIRRRWWEISDALTIWKKSSKRSQSKFAMPPEEAIHHCAKYIGQLVLCTDVKLKTKSMFANVNFPWIIVPDSSFGVIWTRIVISTVFLVLILFPPNLSREQVPSWFCLFKYMVDIIYIIDIGMSLFTSVIKEENVTSNFSAVMFERCKSLQFLLDVLATVWLENLTVIIGQPQFYNLCQFNRLIKIYMLFNIQNFGWNLRTDPLFNVTYILIVTHFSYTYISGYLIYLLCRIVPGVSMSYFFGEKHGGNDTNEKWDPGSEHIVVVFVCWSFQLLFHEYLPNSLLDIAIAITANYLAFVCFMYCEILFIAALYLRYGDRMNYQFYVSQLKKYYRYCKIHQDLLKRLDRYLLCHWKYYEGVEVMHPNSLKNEPYGVYWKVYGEVAERIIGESTVFKGADPALIRELAYAAKFLILPRNSTLFLFGVQCRNVTWIARGYVKCEYHNEKGELLETYYNPGRMLSASSIFLSEAPLKTYTSCTECEILYIKIQDFYEILKYYPEEKSYFENCLHELGPKFDDMIQSYLKKHRKYQNKLRDRIFHARTPLKPKMLNPYPLESRFWRDPEANFIKFWMLFRSIVVFISITCASLQGGCGALIRWNLIMIGAACDCIAWIDITVKLFLAYYDHRGIVITDTRKCMVHYLRRGFLLDVIGALPMHDILNALQSQSLDNDVAMFINTCCKFAHLYILLGYFDYLADLPTVNIAYLMILKWQIVVILTMIGASHYFIIQCVSFTFDKTYNLVQTKNRNGCWLPSFVKIDQKPTIQQLHLLFAESLNFAQSGLLRINLGRFHIDRNNLGIGFTLCLLLLLFWYVMSYSVSLLVLISRSNNLFNHGVNQLRRFLLAERVDTDIINKAVAHFRYWWIRTKGIDMHSLSNERIGVVFRQDLSYYFFKETLTALNTLLQGGESLERQLASTSTQAYFLPNEAIVREMDRISWVSIVHRGKVTLTQNDQKIVTLTKGAIFGLLNDVKPRPVRISATAEGHADLLEVNIKHFQHAISDEVRRNIANNPQSENDYMATKTHVSENPYDTVQFILRGRKTIQLPWMLAPMEARQGSLYSIWLYLVWLVAPVISTILVLIIPTLPQEYALKVYFCLLVTDLVQLANLVAEFYTIELAVIDNKCVNRRVGIRYIKQWTFYATSLTLLVPFITFFTNNDWRYQLIRLIRIRLFYNFHFHFCKSFKSKVTTIIMKIEILCLLLHAMTCGWIYVACRDRVLPTLPPLSPAVNATIDYSRWVVPTQRKNEGCARLTKNNKLNMTQSTWVPSFVVPKYWQDDYMVALTYIVLIHTHTALDIVVPVTLSQIYYKVVMNFFIYLIEIWLISVAMSAVYMKFRELYQYDYNVANLTTYLAKSGLSPSLLKSIEVYTKQLWKRQRGNWLPELTQQAPLCLREDMFCSLYMHHLEVPPVFRNIPHYFTRQLAARLNRTVVFPGRCIIQAGDIFSCIYFIHEGEVEKWDINSSGERKMVTLLTTNGYFGLISGLFPNKAFLFSYYARTVVDLVILRLRDWQDLLDGYPDIKKQLYIDANQFVKEYKMNK